MAGSIPRTERLNAELKKEIAVILSRKLKNPLVTEMVSVTDVDVSRDLKYAHVYISVYSVDEAKKNATFDAISDDSKRIRKFLAESMRTRTVPELNFILDGSMAYGDAMDKLFMKLEKGEKN